MVRTKSLQRFRARTDRLVRDLQALDAAAEVALARIAGQTGRVGEALGLDPARCDRLNLPVSQAREVFRSCVARAYLGAYVELHGFVASYLKSVVAEMLAEGPQLFLARSTTPLALTAGDLAAFHSLDALRRAVAEPVVRTLDGERGTIKLMDRIIAVTGAEVPQDERGPALAYLEMRHLVVHNEAKVSSEFAKRHGARLGLGKGSPVPATMDGVIAAQNALCALIDRLDGELVRHAFPAPIPSAPPPERCASR